MLWRWASAWLAGCVLAGSLGACAPTRTTTLRGPTMGTTWSVQLALPRGRSAAHLQRGIQRELDAVVAQMSSWEPDSDLGRYNRAAAGSWQQLPREFFDVLAHALALARASGGAFDPTVGPLVELWGFGPGPRLHRVPGADAIAAARARVGHAKVQLDPATRRVLQPGGVALDLSAIAKGFGTDQVARYLEREGVGDFLVDISGELRAHGRRPDGGDWRVGIEKPDAAVAAVRSLDQVQRSLRLREQAIATSGDYRHYFEHGGRRYSHHIDPRSGWPVEQRIASVTTVAADCLHADAIGTTLIVLGEDAGLEFARAHGLAVLMLVREGDRFVERTSPAFDALLATP